MEEKKLLIKLCIDQVRLSQIVQLKKLVQKYPGNASVQVDFESESQKVGSIDVESKWGVGESDQLKNELKRLSFIQSFSFDS